MDEAFRALKEFADLCPGQDDVRLMLAEQLSRADRKPEALEQLQLLYDTLEAEGRSGEASCNARANEDARPDVQASAVAHAHARKKKVSSFSTSTSSDLRRRRSRRTSPEPAAPASAKGNSCAALTIPLKSTEPRPSRHPAARVAPDVVARSSRAADDPPGVIENDAVASPRRYAEPRINVAEPHDAMSDVVSHPCCTSFAVIVTTELRSHRPVADNAAARSGSADRARAAGRHHRLPNSDSIDEPEIEDGIRDPTESSSDEEFIDLGEWLERNRTPQSTRMVAHDEAPRRQRAERLRRDARQVQGRQFRETSTKRISRVTTIWASRSGRWDCSTKRSAHFRKRARARISRARARKRIGQCFMDKGEAGVTMTVLERVV